MNKIEKVLLKGFFENITLCSKTRMKVNMMYRVCIYLVIPWFAVAMQLSQAPQRTQAKKNAWSDKQQPAMPGEFVRMLPFSILVLI